MGEKIGASPPNTVVAWSFDENENWQRAADAAEASVREVDAECERLGIPAEFRPSIGGTSWHNRGRNAVKSERTEMRRVAEARIEAMRKRARAEIARQSVELQTNLVSQNLTTEAAREFLAKLPTPEALMPPLSLEKIEDGRAA
jgi:hypothetical protein